MTPPPPPGELWRAERRADAGGPCVAINKSSTVTSANRARCGVSTSRNTRKNLSRLPVEVRKLNRQFTSFRAPSNSGNSAEARPQRNKSANTAHQMWWANRAIAIDLLIKPIKKITSADVVRQILLSGRPQAAFAAQPSWAWAAARWTILCNCCNAVASQPPAALMRARKSLASTHARA